MVRISLSLCFFISSVVCFEETCYNTVDGSSGSCIYINNCDVLLKLVKQRSNDELLKNSKCGIDSVDLRSSSNDSIPKVCCPSGLHIPKSPPNAYNTYNEENKPNISEVKENEEEETCNNTVDGSLGSCINIYNCEVLLKQRSNVKLLRNSTCGIDIGSSSNDFIPKVCCPSGIHISNSTPNANNTYNEKNKPYLSEVKENEEEETCNNTVDGSLGSCIDINNCDVLLKLVKQRSKENDELLRNSKCGIDSVDLRSSSNNFPTVCCPSGKRPLNAAPTATSIMSREPKKAINGIFVDLPEPPICGASGGEIPRVVNGVPAKLGNFPWMALLGYGNRTNYKWKCGGSLISSRHVLTAAHCISRDFTMIFIQSLLLLAEAIYEAIPNEWPVLFRYLVRLGELDWARDDDGATPIDVHIVSAVGHEEYNITSNTDDIGILTLEHTIPFTNLIRPICMPVTPELRSKTFENFTPFVAGWGALNYYVSFSSHLQVAQVEVVSKERCGRAYGRNRIDDRRLCAGENRKDSCTGDSGGPLMQPVQSNFEFYFYQTGVVSFGRGCAEDDYPGVYTRVTHYIPWITEKVTGHN